MARTDENGGRRWTVERTLLVATFLCTAAGFTFGLGVNWASLTRQQARLDAMDVIHSKTIPDTYLRRDVYEANQLRLTDALERLTRALDRYDVAAQTPPVASTVRSTAATREKRSEKEF